MPEQQVAKGIEAMVNLGKGMDGTTFVEDEKFRLEVVPITHSRKKKTLSVVDGYEYQPPPVQEGWLYAPRHWIDRADQEDLGHLMAIVPYAPLICRSRGKLLCIAAGPHAVVIFLALECNIIGMPVDIYRSITSKDYDGPNPDKLRATEELRMFKIPDFLIDLYSSKEERSIKIIAAFVSQRWAWVINDFSSLMVMKVFSRNRFWTASEISPGTEYWTHIFDSLKGGPDWTLEPECASSRLQKWKEDVICDYKKKHLQTTLNFGGGKSSIAKRGSYVSFNRPIISEILSNKHGCFAGIGKYSASDLLHGLTIHPAMPSYIICRNNDLFSQFQTGIVKYLAQFSSSSYIQRASSVPNTLNPFSFNEHLNSEFLSKWVLVYKRTKAKVPIALYDKYLSQGLLDKNHTIGDPYEHESSLENTKQRSWVYLPVEKCKGPAKFSAYTVIRAKIPEKWGSEIEMVPITKDIKEFGYATTIGVPQFHVHVQNRQRLADKEPGTLVIGRPKTFHTGKPGRPRKSPTKGGMKKLLHVQTGRIA